MPQLLDDLARLVAIPSVSEPNFPEHTRPALLETYETILGLLRDVGVEKLGALELPGTAPVLTGEISTPDGAPTVLLYGHYDVVPAGDEEKWESPPFEATERDGAIYGRGAADSKSNILVHVGALRAWDGKPPVGVKVLIEGQEEVGSPLETPRSSAGSRRTRCWLPTGATSAPASRPSQSALRGDAVVTVEVRTLAQREAQRPVRWRGARRSDHVVTRTRIAARRARRRRSGGPAPRRVEGRIMDRRRIPAARRDGAGAPVHWHGRSRRPRLVGRAITITGIDVPSVDGAVERRVAVRARQAQRSRGPEQDAAEAQAAVMRHLEALRPFGIPLQVHAGETGTGSPPPPTGPRTERASPPSAPPGERIRS